MTTRPWTARRRLAPLRAPHPHDQLGRRARAPGARRATTSAPGTTSSRSPTTGTAASAPSTERLLVLPGVELNCVAARATATGTCSASGSTRDPAELEGERRDLAGDRATGSPAHGGVAYLAHPYWTRRCAPEQLELPRAVTGIEVFNAGCELEVGRGAVVACTGTSCSSDGRLLSALATDDSPPSRLRLRPRLDVGARAERTPESVLDALRDGPLLRLAPGPLIHDVEVGDGDGRSCGAARAASVTLVRGRTSGARGERGPARLPLRRRRSSSATTDGSIVAARLDRPCDAPVRAASRSPTPPAASAWTNPLWI